MTVVVSGLGLYPVKSLAGRCPSRIGVGALGPEGDRRWMVVDASGRFATQRSHPRMCLLAADSDGAALVLSGASAEPCRVLLSRVLAQARLLRAEVWGEMVDALDAGDEAAAWLSAQLGDELRLCYMPDTAARQVDTDFGRRGDRVGFADGFPFLLVSEQSVADVSHALGRPFDAWRMRPNILIRGAAAFAEDGWRRLRIGELEFEVVKPCSRCVIPSINPATAERESDVVQALRRYRRADGKIYFGQNLIHRGEGEIRTGDRVEVLE